VQAQNIRCRNQTIAKCSEVARQNNKSNMALSATAWETLAPVRNAFYLGNFQDCQRDARALMDKRNSSLQAMPEVYFFRSLIQLQKFDAVLKGITAGSPVAVQILKLLAQFKQASVEARDSVFSALSEFLVDEATSSDPTVRLIAAQIHLEDGNFKEALKLVHDGDTLEMYVSLDKISFILM
jgi:hypothetical protein